MLRTQCQTASTAPAYNLSYSNSFPILELLVKFPSQICHENINKPLDGAYLADFGIDITFVIQNMEMAFFHNMSS